MLELATSLEAELAAESAATELGAPGVTVTVNMLVTVVVMVLDSVQAAGAEGAALLTAAALDIAGAASEEAGKGTTVKVLTAAAEETAAAAAELDGAAPEPLG